MLRNLLRVLPKPHIISLTNSCKYETQLNRKLTSFTTAITATTTKRPTSCFEINKCSNIHTSQNTKENNNLTSDQDANNYPSYSHVADDEINEENILDVDDYIIPYRTNAKFNEQLSSVLRLKPAAIEKIKEIDPKVKTVDPIMLRAVLDIIVENGISNKSIMENPFLLRINPADLRKRISIIKQMNFVNINDAVPLLLVPEKRLYTIGRLLRREKEMLRPFNNRFYYMSEKLQIEPKIVVKYLSSRLFILKMSFDNFSEILNYMLEYGVKPMNILKDLWAFRYTPENVRLRLERALTANKNKIMPWMVRCPESILENSLKLSLYERQLLGKDQSIIDYLSQRLGYDIETTKGIMSKHPAVLKVRIKKVKEVLDYLLDEAGFTAVDIARCPRVLCHKLETTRSRLEQLKSHGCTPSTLVIVCRSRREYEKFLKNWISVRNKIQERSSNVN